MKNSLGITPLSACVIILTVLGGLVYVGFHVPQMKTVVDWRILKGGVSIEGHAVTHGDDSDCSDDDEDNSVHCTGGEYWTYTFQWEGHSYTGRTGDETYNDTMSEGDSINVAFLPDDPSVNCVEESLPLDLAAAKSECRDLVILLGVLVLFCVWPVWRCIRLIRRWKGARVPNWPGMIAGIIGCTSVAYLGMWVITMLPSLGIGIAGILGMGMMMGLTSQVWTWIGGNRDPENSATFAAD